MYSYTYDEETGGILLNSTPTIFSKEPRPVYAPELDLLGFDKYWKYDNQSDIGHAFKVTSSACDSVNTRVSHVIKAIHVPEEYAEGTIRVTFGAENTEEEAVTIAESLVGILKTM